MAIINIKGKQYELTQEQVINAMEGVTPKPVRAYYIEVKGREYPIKQVVAVALKIPTAAFGSMDAYELLDRLGFRVNSISK